MNQSWLFPLCSVTATVTVLLLAAGALVTGTGSGLAVPDWPLSFGQFFPPMIGGVLYEHGHRMIAGVVALLTAAQTFLFVKTEPRKGVRRLAVWLLVLVCVQASFGGLTVLFRLPPAVSVVHATLAQIFFSLAVVLVFLTSRAWREETAGAVSRSFAWAATALMGLLFLQLIFGATVRHYGAALAFPDFPLVGGALWPSEWGFRNSIHYAHRLGGFLALACAAAIASCALRSYFTQTFVVGLCGFLTMALVTQVGLGGVIVWAKRPIPITTLHLVLGAMILAASVALTVVAWAKARQR